MSASSASEWDSDGSDAALSARLAEVESALGRAYDGYVDGVEERLADLRATLGTVRERHAALRDELAPASDEGGAEGAEAAPIEEWDDLWTRVCAYRRRMQDEVLEPICDHLEDRPLGPRLTERRAACETAVPMVADDVPVTLTRPEPEGVYEAAPEDGWQTAVRKRLVRGWRQTRRGVGLDDAAPDQTVPARALVRRHVGALRARQAPVLDAVEEQVMGWVSTLERAVTAVTHALLEFEQRVDHLDFHETQAEVAAPVPGQPDVLDRAASLEAPAEPPSPDVVETVRRTLDAFDDALEEGASLSVEEHRRSLRAHVEEEMAALRAAVDEPWPDETADDHTPSDGADWGRWDEQARTRLRLCDTMIEFYVAVEEHRDAMIEQLQAEGPQEVRDRIDTITSRLEACDDELSDRLAESNGTGTALAEPIEAALDTVQEHLGVLEDRSFGEQMRAVVQDTKAAVRDQIAALPETVTVHSVSDPEVAPDPAASGQTVSVREEAAITFDVLFFDRLQAAAQRVVEALGAEVDRLGQVVEVLQFGRTSAREEEEAVSAASMPHRPDGVEQGTALDDVDALVRGSVHRSLRLLEAREARIGAASHEWADTVWTAFRKGMTRLHKQWSTERPLQSQVVSLTRQVAREARDAATQAQEQVQHGRAYLQKQMEVGRRWLEWGRRVCALALGVGEPEEEAVSESIETIAALGDSLDRLPVVYRRLFSFDPVDDPDLFKGREEERAFIRRHVERWREGIPASLLLVGNRGSGLTSLLKVARAEILREAELHHLQFDRRPETEAELAVQVARTFGVEGRGRGGTLTLDAVGEALRDAAPRSGEGPAPMRVCFVEHIEQLLLQTVGGLDLLDRMLTLISRTDAHVFWVATMSTSAWQLVEKRLPAAAELVTHRSVSPLGRDALEDIVMSRHRRSGLSLHFEAPDRPTALQVRQTQAERREAFFDRLHEVSHQNVALALLYWFRSVERRADGDGLRVMPLRPLSLQVLDELTLEQAFTLKAFLVHSTLTVEEYSRVAQIPEADSVDLIESLGNASLIEPVDRSSGFASDVYFEAVSTTDPYRIRPVLVAPIIDHLEADNIVH